MTLVVYTNVLLQQRGSVFALPPRRRRLSTIMRQHGRGTIPLVFRKGQDWRQASRVEIDRAARMRADYSSTLVGPHDMVVLLRPVRGKNGASIGLALAAIALMVVAPYVAPALGSVGVFAVQSGLPIGSAGLSLHAGTTR